MKAKNIVCFGGGTGLSTLLRGVKRWCEPTAIVTMADSGGHSGRLRDELGVLPPGDVRSCLVALADDTKAPLLRDLFSYRFQSGSYTGANVGNLLLAALSDILGDFNKGVKAAHDLLGLRGTVIPVTLESCDLLAELEDGTILFGEKTIDLPRLTGHIKIKRVWLQPRVKINTLARRALLEADVIIFGPGDLYTSIVPNLYVDGVVNTIRKTQAKLIYVTNIMTKHGETDNFTVEDFEAVLTKHLPRPVDKVVHNTAPVPMYLVERYKEEKAIPVVGIGSKSNWQGVDVLSTAGELARHDSEKLGKALQRIIAKM